MMAELPRHFLIGQGRYGGVGKAVPTYGEHAHLIVYCPDIVTHLHVPVGYSPSIHIDGKQVFFLSEGDVTVWRVEPGEHTIRADFWDDFHFSVEGVAEDQCNTELVLNVKAGEVFLLSTRLSGWNRRDEWNRRRLSTKRQIENVRAIMTVCRATQQEVDRVGLSSSVESIKKTYSYSRNRQDVAELKRLNNEELIAKAINQNDIYAMKMLGLRSRRDQECAKVLQECRLELIEVFGLHPDTGTAARKWPTEAEELYLAISKARRLAMQDHFHTERANGENAEGIDD